MPAAQKIHTQPYSLNFFLDGKPEHTLFLFDRFVTSFKNISPEIQIIPAKTMIGVATQRKRIAWITQLGKNFLHVVFPFEQAFTDNLCFQKIAQVPGQQQYNHHLRIYDPADTNEEVLYYMKLALQKGQ